MSSRALLAVAVADFRERTRRPAFLATIAATLWLASAVVTGSIRMHLGAWRGISNSAWIGVLMALVAGTFVSLVGFYVVKGSLERDRATGVGQILAATPLTRLRYLLGKAVSNLLLFGVVAAVLTGAGLAMQLLAGEDRHVVLARLVVPMLVFAVPALAVIAAFAVLFECVPFLRGGFGNVAWFFLWGAICAIPIAGKNERTDILGITPVQRQLAVVVSAHDPGYKNDFSLNAGPGMEREVTKTFVWDGLAYTPALLAQRVSCLGLALGIVVFAGIFFDRFDTAPRLRFRAPRRAAKVVEAAENPAAPRESLVERHLTALTDRTPRGRFLALYAAELKLLAKGLRWWWYLGAAGLVVAGATSPLETARHQVLAFTWLWPVLLWSPLGNREARTGTAPFLFAVPRPVGRPLAAAWLAGATVALATGAGVGIRLAHAGEAGKAFGFFAGALFIPALALACGTWSGTSKLFEGLYTALWYIGPAQGKPEAALDFMCASAEAVARGTAYYVLAATAICLALAVAGRRRQLALL